MSTFHKCRTKCPWGGVGPDSDPPAWLEPGQVGPKVELCVECGGSNLAPPPGYLLLQRGISRTLT